MAHHNPSYDQTPEKSYSYMVKEEPSRRSQGYGAHHRNKSYDIALSKGQGSKGLTGGHGVSQGMDKSVVSLWGFTRGLGLDANLEKIGELDEELKDISFSDGHVVVLTEGNKVLVRGKNDSKQLGFDSKETLCSFKMLSLPPSVKFVRVECGGDFTFALGWDGEVFSWGLNLKGQLGHGHFDPVASAAQLRYLSNSSESRSPRVSRKSKDNGDEVKLSYGEKIVDVSCGALHSLLLTNKGKIFACGYGETHALGLGHRDNQCTFCEVPFFSSGEFYDKSITKISTGISHSACIVGDSAFVWGVWGSKPQMVYTLPNQIQVGGTQLGGSSSGEPVVDIKLGDLLSVFLTSSGDVYTMGDNTNGQLGLGDELNSISIPTKVSIDIPVSNIACGSNHAFCYTKDCKIVYAWGSNYTGQIWPGSEQKKYTSPIKFPHLLVLSRISCSSRGTIGISRMPLDFGTREDKGSGDSLKKVEAVLQIERSEKDALKKANQVSVRETNQLKQEVLQLKAALANAERVQKRTFFSNASTQTAGECEDTESAFDGRFSS